MISTELVDISRLQFAVTALYHFLFVPLTLGLAFMLVTMELTYVTTGRPDLQGHGQVLGQAVRHQLCAGRDHRHHHGIPVRHQLGVLLALCRRHFRRAAGHRRPDGILPGVHLYRPVFLWLGQTQQMEALHGDGVHGGGFQPVRVVDSDCQWLDAKPGRLASFHS